MKATQFFVSTTCFMLVVTLLYGQNSTKGYDYPHPDHTLLASIPIDANGIGISNSFQDFVLSSDDLFRFNGSFMNDDKCARFTKMRRAGTVLVIVGPIGLGVGLISIIMGSIHDQPGAIYGGGALCTVGSIALGAGIPLKIIGKKKSRQYCGDSNSSILELNTSGNGIALNYRF